jgi:hypothetical protein
LARLIVDEGWPVARAAERFDDAWLTAKRWATSPTRRFERHLETLDRSRLSPQQQTDIL